MSDDTFTQTFADGFTVRIDRSVATNCPRQAEWLKSDIEGLKRTIAILASHAPAGTSHNSLIALALQQKRAAWAGINGLQSAHH